MQMLKQLQLIATMQEASVRKMKKELLNGAKKQPGRERHICGQQTDTSAVSDWTCHAENDANWQLRLLAPLAVLLNHSFSLGSAIAKLVRLLVARLAV